MIREDQLEASPARPAFRSEVFRMSTTTAHRFRPRLGCSLLPLGKPLVSVWRREPGTDARSHWQVAQKFLASACRRAEELGS